MAAGRFFFDPFARDIAVFLGPTEANLIELAWGKKDLTVKKALFYLGDDNRLAYTTVMTILNRLANKGLLKIQKRGRHYVYNPAVTRAEFIKERKRVITNCLKQFK